MSHHSTIHDLLKNVRYASMATVNEDGTPHNSPLVFLYDDKLEHIYWGSHPESQHSQNVLRTGQAFFVAFNSLEGSTGVYIQANQGCIVEGEELESALKIHNHFRAKMGKKAIEIGYYQGNSPQRMWQAKVEKIWLNAYERDASGMLIKDYKVEVKIEELK